MANELRHDDVGNSLSKAEWEAIGTHIFNSQATGDILIASSATQLSRLAAVATGKVLASKGVGTAPAWDDVPAHGAAQHTDVTRNLFLPAGSSALITGTNNLIGRFGNVRGAADGVIQVGFSIKVPDDFVSYTTLKAVWVTAGTGNMQWQIVADWAANGEDKDTHSEDPAFGVTAAATADVIYVQEPANTLTLANLAIGDYLGLTFTRDGTDGADTLDAFCYFLGLLFTYVANQ